MENLNKNQILEWYTDDVLSGNTFTNVYSFAQKHDIVESDFYNYFADLGAIESFFFEEIFHATLNTLHSAEDYEVYPAKDKWLSFYFTFFENLKMNRSFVKYTVGNQHLKDLKKFKKVREAFLKFAKEIETQKIDFNNKEVNKIQNKAMEEFAWLHLLSTIKFWLNDDSANFEKTDLFIEKSINTGFELVNVNALNSVADFGKFMVKEVLNLK